MDPSGTSAPDDALASLRRACERAPRDAEAWLRLGIHLDSLALHDEAIVAGERLLALAPQQQDIARLLLGRNLQALGRIDEAASHYRRIALAGGPRAYQAWFSLVDLKTVRLSEQELATLERYAHDARIGEEPRMVLHFALGKALEDAGRFAEAFDAFVYANTQRRRSANWTAARFARQVEVMQASFATAREGAPGTLGEEIIFIVGLPRSSTTLIEQIFAAHPEVEGASELHDLPAVVAEESKRRGVGFPLWVPEASAADWARLGRAYLERTQRWRRTRTRSTDKLPGNWMYAGAIRAMLPGAKIIDCRRDPLETCWSCYKQLFAPSMADYSYDFGDLGAHWRGYDHLVRHWIAQHPGAMFSQSYEDLLQEPEAQIRALLAFCDLPFDPACLAFHTASRGVRTASAAQVRQPLRRDTARAQAYGDLMTPLRAALVNAS